MSRRRSRGTSPAAGGEYASSPIDSPFRFPTSFRFRPHVTPSRSPSLWPRRQAPVFRVGEDPDQGNAQLGNDALGATPGHQRPIDVREGARPVLEDVPEQLAGIDGSQSAG